MCWCWCSWYDNVPGTVIDLVLRGGGGGGVDDSIDEAHRCIGGVAAADAAADADAASGVADTTMCGDGAGGGASDTTALSTAVSACCSAALAAAAGSPAPNMAAAPSSERLGAVGAVGLVKLPLPKAPEPPLRRSLLTELLLAKTPLLNLVAESELVPDMLLVASRGIRAPATLAPAAAALPCDWNDPLDGAVMLRVRPRVASKDPRGVAISTVSPGGKGCPSGTVGRPSTGLASSCCIWSKPSGVTTWKSACRQSDNQSSVVPHGVRDETLRHGGSDDLGPQHVEARVIVFLVYVV